MGEGTILHTEFQQLGLRQADSIPDVCWFGGSCCESEKEFLIKQALLCHQLRKELTESSKLLLASQSPRSLCCSLPYSCSLLVVWRYWLGQFVYGDGDQES